MSGADSGWGGKYTRNPFRLAAAEVRYRLGNRVRDFMSARDLTSGVWEPLFRWAWGSESAYNCLLLPDLARRVRAENRTRKQGQKYLKRVARARQAVDSAPASR